MQVDMLSFGGGGSEGSINSSFLFSFLSEFHSSGFTRLVSLNPLRNGRKENVALCLNSEICVSILTR